MKAALLALLIGLAVAACGDAQKAREDPGARIAARTVAIEILGRDEAGAFIVHGAGTILHEAGYVLTCEHITSRGERQQVVLRDGRAYPFHVLARAGGTHDTAVLRFDAPPGLEAVVFGRSAEVAVGDEVLLVGMPSGRGLDVRRARVELASCGGGTQIQVRGGEIGPGFSGGPVANGRGEQVALIHVAITTAERTSRHIRIDHVRRAFEERLQVAGQGARPLGLVVDCHAERARVKRVAAGSAAGRAGVRVGDVVVRAGGLVVRHGLHYVLALLDRDPAEPLELVLERAGRRITARL